MNEKCGVVSGDQQEFIFGGTETGDHAYPWMAGLAYKLPGMNSGWLISESISHYLDLDLNSKRPGVISDGNSSSYLIGRS